MKSNRIIYSDRHFHEIRLSEEAMGIIQHGLYVLSAGFQLEPEYHQLIQNTRKVIEDAFNGPVIET